MGCPWKVRGFSTRNKEAAENKLGAAATGPLTGCMKTKSLLAALLVILLAVGLHAGTPAQEKEFLDKYKAAFEKGDTDTLESFLYIKDAHPMALEFYKRMQSDGAGRAKISSIELLDLTPEDVKKASEIQTGPDGSKAQLPLKPTKKLQISLDRQDTSGKAVTSTTSFVAEKDGKYVIPVPAAVK